MNGFDIKRRDLFSVGPHMLGLIFFAVGIFTMLSPLFMTVNNSASRAITAGAGFMFFGLTVILSYGGTFFDFKNRKYKKYYSMSGFKMGQWQDLPALKLIKFSSHTFKSTRSFDGVHPSVSGHVTIYRMALYASDKNPFLVFESRSKDRILKEAKILSDNLKVSLEVQE